MDAGLRFNGNRVPSSAQTGRRGGAGPAGSLLGGKDPTGRVYPKTFQSPDYKRSQALPA
jgi:hypothetical protein